MLTRFSRANSITLDSEGIDPLLDKLMPSIQAISLYRDHIISIEEKGAPDLISMNHYGTANYWWHFMVYNSITHVSQLYEGVHLKMPEVSELLRVSSSNADSNGSPVLVDRLVEI